MIYKEHEETIFKDITKRFTLSAFGRTIYVEKWGTYDPENDTYETDFSINDGATTDLTEEQNEELSEFIHEHLSL